MSLILKEQFSLMLQSIWKLLNNKVSKEEFDTKLSDKVDAPTTATVGQILAVKSVDSTNKPTEWETVDIPAGGGESAYPGDDHINDLINTALGVIENGTY